MVKLVTTSVVYSMVALPYALAPATRAAEAAMMVEERIFVDFRDLWLVVLGKFGIEDLEIVNGSGY